jgi:site-specific DNA recombinase
MMVQMLGVFAEFERATIIDRVIAGMERKAAKGGWTNGPPPYGYRINGDYLEPDPNEAPLVTAIFTRYTRGRMGTQAIAGWLNDAGHRTRAGRRWSHISVISLLRNRVYIGQIYFRGTHHDAPHPPLVDADTFDGAERLLVERGDDVSKRASNSSDYLLSGLIKCARCGKRYVGKASHGRNHRYRYYTCHTRHRYGPDACDGDRLPAGELDTAALNGILTLYAHRDLFDRVANQAAARRTTDRAQHQRELAKTDADIAKTEQAIERYLLAFEAGTLPEVQCGNRVRDLGAKLVDLQDRRNELHELLTTATPTTPNDEQLAEARKHIRDAIDHGDDQHRTQLLQAVIAEIRVESREHITPVYRVPHAQQVDTVRIVEGQVVRGGVEPPTSRFSVDQA